jgi:signal transduction histidine kinase
MADPRPKILIADDSAAYRRVIQTMLGPAYEFLLVESAEEALRKSIAFCPDLVISDLIMAGMDGYELCRRIKAEAALRHVPVILLTSKTGDESRAAGLEVGADDYLFKPIRPRELTARVSSLLRLRRATLALEEQARQLETANESLKKAQAELIRSEKLASLGQLVAGIAHELNNPLNYIYGNTNFLSEYVSTLLGLVDKIETLPDLSESQRAALKELENDADLEYVKRDMAKLLDGLRLGAERAAEIVKGLRAFARAGSSNMQLEEVDLASTVDVALTVLRHELRDRIEVHRHFDEVPKVRCDASRVSQVLVNLILNASQAIEGKGDIHLSIRSDGPMVGIAVRDTGPGIAEDIRPKVFDPFFTTKPVGQGTGLGLSISYGIVEQHGGRIEIASEKGKGATFTVLLPVSGPPPKGLVPNP